ncbi:MAG: TonB-dependent receptor [Candidatus Marinimicrobia bacterium]|nr:TonB-dependent receptor [Candidatus Neomarinimicrobiota bacterium]
MVADSCNNSVSYVFINNSTKNLWTITDENGEFMLPFSFKENDSIRFSRIGFKTKTIRLSKKNNPLHIILTPTPVLLKEVRVSAKRDQIGIRNHKMAEISRSPEIGDVEHRQLLAGIPGLSIRSYGGPAGITTLSLDGGPASQTKVIVSGFDLTNAQNGEMDLSQLPGPFVENVSYIPQDENSYGSGKSEGTIHLNPGSGRTKLSICTGSYGHSSIYGNLNLHKNQWIGNFLIGKRHDDGNYPFKWRNERFKRENNFFDQKFISAQFNSVLQKRAFLRFLYLLSNQNRGIAGQSWNPSKNASRDDKLQIVGIKFGWTNKKGHGYIQTMYRYSWEHYKNPMIAVNSSHRLSTWQIILNQEKKINEKIGVNLLFETKKDGLKSKDTNNHYRISYSTVITVPYYLLEMLKFQPAYCYDISPNLYHENTYELKLLISFNFLFIKSLTLHQGRYFRYPTFNDLYWIPGGNPNLKPEHTDNISFDINCHLIQDSDLEILFFHKSSDDLIQWTPISSYWQPKNIQHAVRKGYKIIYRWISSNLQLNAFAHYSSNRTKDLSPGDCYGKPLRYAPKQTAAVGINWKPEPLSFHLQVHHTSERISMYSWPEDIILPEVTLIFTSCAYTWKRPYGDIIIVFAVDNLTDKRYETIKGYPEPGRTFRTTVSYQY